MINKLGIAVDKKIRSISYISNSELVDNAVSNAVSIAVDSAIDNAIEIGAE